MGNSLLEDLEESQEGSIEGKGNGSSDIMNGKAELLARLFQGKYNSLRHLAG